MSYLEYFQWSSLCYLLILQVRLTKSVLPQDYIDSVKNWAFPVWDYEHKHSHYECNWGYLQFFKQFWVFGHKWDEQA